MLITTGVIVRDGVLVVSVSDGVCLHNPSSMALSMLFTSAHSEGRKPESKVAMCFCREKT